MPKKAPFPSTGMATLSGLIAAGLGLAYISYAFGPTEQEVVTWGQITFYSGLGIALLTLVGRRLSGAARLVVRTVLALSLTAMALLQIPPALLWILFHNQGISDGSPPSAFVAHWAYSLLHIAATALSLTAAVRLFTCAEDSAENQFDS